MSKSTAKTFDLAAASSMALILALNLLFVLSFFLVLLALPAKAEAAACTGRNLLADLAASDPAALTRMREQAAATPNGEGLLWKVEKAGVEPSYLFGTMHMTDPRVVDLPEEARLAFDEASTLVIETTDVLDQAKMMAAMLARPELMMFTGGETLAGLLSPAEIEAVKAGLEARDIPFASVAKMKPWMLSAMIALPACEFARKAAGAPVLDIKLAEDAKAAGKQVGGLETVIDQLQAMASLPMEFHVKGLVDTLELGTRIDDVIETMIVLYTQGEIGMFWPMFEALLPAEPGDQNGFAAFEEAMVTVRNRGMAEHAQPILDRGDAFIAVGALHLPGENGLIALLREAGYTVAPAG